MTRHMLLLLISLAFVSCTVTTLPSPPELPSPTQQPSPDPTEPDPTEPDPEQPNPEIPAGEVIITFIDVGQGDAVLIQGTSGQTVLYDGGRSDDDALDYLISTGITTLDLVIASHPDADHIGGLDAVIDYYQPRLFMDNGVVATTRTYQDLLESVANAGSQLIEPTRRSIGLGDATLEIIPPPGVEAFDNNNRSIGLILDFGLFEVALTGDAEEDQFNWWLSNTPEYLREVEVYKSAHHGSRNGDTPESVAAFSPEVVVISVGATNPYGHPAEEALELYEGVGATVYRTDLDGTVTVTGRADGGYSLVTSQTP